MEVNKCIFVYWAIFLAISLVHLSETAFYKLSTSPKYSGKVLKSKWRYFQEKLSPINCLLKCDMDIACQSVFYGIDNQNCIGYTSAIIKSTKLKDTSEKFNFFAMKTACERKGFSTNKRYKTCYKVHTTKKTFSEARQICKRYKMEDGDLVVLKPQKKMEAFLELIKEREYKSSMWIGLTDKKKEGVWRFLDGQKATYWKYVGKFNNYDAQYPGKSADCGCFSPITVFDRYCGAKLNFVCELKNITLE